MNFPTVEELKGHPVFGALDTFNLERLLQLSRLEQLRRHEILLKTGDRCDKTLLILDGSIKVTATAPNQREVILDILGGGGMVGEEGVIDERSVFGADVMRDAVVLSMPAHAIRTILARSPEFTVAWIRQTYAGKQRLQQRVTELAYGNIDDRLFRVLSHLARHHGSRTSKGNFILQFRITHQELANLIGATRETTTVAIGRLCTSGAIGFRERKIILKDRLRMDALLDDRAG